jgi:uncharacterized protein (TIGR02099 family)
MKNFLQRLFKILAYAAAGVVILLAIAVGLFRLFLPRLPEYQDEIKSWASAAIGMQVDFSGMNARWGLSGPQLEFYDAELVRGSTMTRVVAAEQVSVGVALTRLLVDRTLVIDRVVVRDTTVEVRQLPNGRWWIQGTPASDLLNFRSGAADDLGAIEFIAEEVELQLIRPGDERPTFFDIDRVIVRKDEHRLAVDGSVRLPPALGRQLRLNATQLLGATDQVRAWDVSLEASELVLSGLADFDDSRDWPSLTGAGNLDVAVAWLDGHVESATAEFELDEVTIAGADEFSAVGRVEYRSDPEGWLVAANEFRISTAAGTWPESSLRLETSIDRDGNVVMIDARGDYLNLDDVGLITPLLDDERRRELEGLAPDGIVRNLIATLSDVHTEDPSYAVSADLENVGVAAGIKRPGMRGFTGKLRADRSGGRLEIDSGDIVLDLVDFLPEEVPIEAANGTVIWRRSGDRITVLSDNIMISNADLQSQSNIQVTLDKGEAPVVDLVSNWSISDIGSAKRFIPGKVMHRKLYDWFQDALVSGRISQGTTRLFGPLDKFPFDGGEGRFLLQAKIRDMTFQFHKEWPAAEIIELDVTLDNTRLYSERNRSINRGREIVDAKVEIGDVRKPVLTIDSYSTGSLESIHAYAQNSPIGRLFGGHLRRVRIEGDASFNLDLMVPITDWRNFTFTARIVSNDGTVQVEGFNPPITGLSGAVTIDRENVTSEALGGQFLGYPVTIDVMNAPASLPEFQVVARALGEVDSTGLVDGLGLPVGGLVEGHTDYAVDLLFPRGKREVPVPFTVRVTSDLVGLSVGLPAPFLKPADEQASFSGDIAFIPGGQRIESRGTATGGVGWQIAFAHDGDIWDLERGTLALGGGEVTEAETRGLHIRGNIEDIVVDDWLRLSRGDETRSGAAERIRSIEVDVANLRILGQHLRDHRARVDRSARDWLVQIEGDSVAGSVFVPYDFGSDRALVLDMERLVLPGDDENPVDAREQVHPDALPPITLTAEEFGLGDRFFGAVDVQFAKTEEGLVADSFTAKDATSEIVGNARWVIDESDPLGHRSHLMATLTSTDVSATMQRLAYQPGIVSDDMMMLLDVNWSGGPRADVFDSLNGDVQVRFGVGQLNEVEPGAGRLFGLMSIVALPRRLSLDFTDVFDKGFGFDKIDGSFHIVDGEAYTCNLSLEGPAADIAIIGRASLTGREYEQVAVVSANFGNTLPVVGAVVAGPQAAAALLIFSQIFKKPLQEMGQVYYGIAGSWDEPLIESTDAANFAASAELAGCILDSE